jgi:hypothetical protein
VGGRSRKRRRVVVGDAAFAPRETQDPRPERRPARLRGEARNEQIRAGLEPLAPGERPRALRVAIAVALGLGVLDLALLAAGYSLQGRSDPAPAGVVLRAVVALVAAWGMWRRRYWAVLGFECLLAITCVWAFGSLAVASNWEAVALCSLIGLSAAWLFWKLVRVMARMQMPDRPGAARG